MSAVNHPSLVVLSVVIAIFAFYTTLDLAMSLTIAGRRGRVPWLAGGALAMGSGIWSMHVIGMLALSLPGMVIAYDAGPLMLSVLIAVAPSAGALAIVSRKHVSRLATGVAGLALGAGIALVHFVVAGAMRMAPRRSWALHWLQCTTRRWPRCSSSPAPRLFP